MLNKIKEYLNIDSDITDFDNTLNLLANAAIIQLEAATGKRYKEDNELMLLYIMLCVKVLFEGHAENATHNAIQSTGHIIKLSEEFENKETGGA